MENLDVMTPETMVAISEKKGKEFAGNNGIKTNQIRNFYSAVNSIRVKMQEKNKFKNDDKEKVRFVELTREIHTELILLEPKLAYAAGRQTKVKPFYDFVKELIDAYKLSINRESAIINFITIIESVVAYHKFYGGDK